MIHTNSSLSILINLAIISCLLLSGCRKKLNCDSSDNVNLGTTDYSEEFKTWSIESDQNTLTFYNNNDDTLRLNAQPIVTDEPRWLIESVECEEAVDVKPFIAYAYYEYEDKSHFFNADDDSALLTIEPEIALQDEIRTESIFIGFSTNAATSIKGQVPVTNPDAIPEMEPFGLHFQYVEFVELDDRIYIDTWMLTQNELSIYYHKELGIVALIINEVVYHRVI